MSLCSYALWSQLLLLFREIHLHPGLHSDTLACTLLPTDRFVSTTTNPLKCLVNWILLRICVSLAKHVFLIGSQRRSRILQVFVSPEVVHRPRSDYPLHFGIIEN